MLYAAMVFLIPVLVGLFAMGMERVEVRTLRTRPTIRSEERPASQPVRALPPATPIRSAAAPDPPHTAEKTPA